MVLSDLETKSSYYPLVNFTLGSSAIKKEDNSNSKLSTDLILLTGLNKPKLLKRQPKIPCHLALREYFVQNTKMTLQTEDHQPKPQARRMLFYDPQTSPTHSSFENIPICDIEKIQCHIDECYNERYNKPVHGRVQALRNGDPENRSGRKDAPMKTSENRTPKRPLKENSNLLNSDEKLPGRQSRFDCSKKYMPEDQDSRRVTPLIYRKPTIGFHRNPTEELKHLQAKQAYYAFLEARKLQRKNAISSISDLTSDESDSEDDPAKPKFGDDGDDGLIFQLEL